MQGIDQLVESNDASFYTFGVSKLKFKEEAQKMSCHEGKPSKSLKI